MKLLKSLTNLIMILIFVLSCTAPITDIIDDNKDILPGGDTSTLNKGYYEIYIELPDTYTGNNLTGTIEVTANKNGNESITNTIQIPSDKQSTLFTNLVTGAWQFNLSMTGDIKNYITFDGIQNNTIIGNVSVDEVKYTRIQLRQTKVTDLKFNQSNGSLEITTDTKDAEIYYTTDGSEPAKTSSQYSDAFEIPEGGVTIKARAFIDGMIASDITEEFFAIGIENNTFLKSLSTSEGTLSPAFTKNTLNYTVNVSNATSSIEVNAQADDSNASITIKKGTTTITSPVSLTVGNNDFTITVTNGEESKVYNLSINRAQQGVSNNADLAELSFNNGDLSPVFKTETKSYTLTVPSGTNSLGFTATTQDSNASLDVTKNDDAVTGTTIAINGTDATLVFTVTAEDTTTSLSYTVNVVVAEPLELTGLTVNEGSLSPDFNPSTSSYTVEVAFDITSVDVSATANAGVSVKVNGGSASEFISLNVGVNNVTVVLTSADGNTTEDYTVSITRKKETVTDKIVLHVYDYTHIWAWKPGDENINYTGGTDNWPGFEMSAEDNQWYGITLDVTSLEMVLSNNGNNQTPPSNQGGYEINTAGEYWFKDGDLTDYNPNDNIDPTVSIITPQSGSTLTGNVSITVNAADNNVVDRIEYYFDNKLIGKSETQPFNLNWNSAFSANKTALLKAIAYDGSSNSAVDSITITTSNANLSPVADAGGDKVAFIQTPKSLTASASYDPNGEIVSWEWSFSDGGSASGETVQHSFNSTGTFTATLTVTDDEGETDSDTINIEVREGYERTDFREETIYFLMTARFYDGDSSNNRYTRSGLNAGADEIADPAWRGDFKGLIEKLDYIKAMGFSAIWITPPVLNRSDCDYHGYHAYDMTKIDARLESNGAKYQDLIDEIHARDMKVVQDVVINHSSKYGEVNLGGRILWGDSEDPQWGTGMEADYYDVENPDFEYNGLDYEPNSGKNYYTGGTYQAHKPTEDQLPWLYDGDDSYMDPYLWIKGPNDLQPNLDAWGVVAGTSPEGWQWRNFQWSEHAYTLLNPEYYHLINLGNWEAYDCQQGTMHPDCVDLNTESAATQQFLIDTYNQYIDMGVDAFRVDTAKHISRVMFNRHFVPAWKERGGENFYIFGEVLVKSYDLYPNGAIPLGAPFYTWKEGATGVSSGTGDTLDPVDWIAAKEGYDTEQAKGKDAQPHSKNHYLDGNNYHTPDYSQRSGLDIIDMQAHVNFSSAGKVWGIRGNDEYYNDATWNVVYVDSHDYGPSTSSNRFAGGASAWAENFSLMFTWRGIPCVYYGSEIEFKSGKPTDGDPNKLLLADSGRAYYGDHIEGDITVNNFSEWSNATGALATTMDKPLVKHLAHLNKLRRMIPALQKGQYSTDGVSKELAFKKRFTDEDTDSFVLVTISGDATFSGIPGGTYKDAITGDTQTISEGGSLSTSGCSGQGNLRVYVLDTAKTPAPGKINGQSLYLN